MRRKPACRRRWPISSAPRRQDDRLPVLPMEIQHRCYMCYLPMPFSKRARFVLANDSDKDYRAEHGLRHRLRAGPAICGREEPLALHVAEEQSRGRRRQRQLDHLIEPSQTGGKNRIDTAAHDPRRERTRPLRGQLSSRCIPRIAGWWGEGVTIFHLDGQTMVHTPGTEDEYGSCWGFGAAFSDPYCGYLPQRARATTACIAGMWPTRCGSRQSSEGRDPGHPRLRAGSGRFHQRRLLVSGRTASIVLAAAVCRAHRPQPGGGKEAAPGR